MADVGVPQFANAAVQVIPVLVVAIMADQFIRRDSEQPTHRIHAATSIAVGLIFGISGEIAGLLALLNGPSGQTVPVVAEGLIALAVTALGPRLAELLVHRAPDVARRVAQRLLPVVIGGVGLVVSTSRAPLCGRVATYALIGLSFLTVLAGAVHQARLDRAAERAESTAQPASRSADVSSPTTASSLPTPPDAPSHRWLVIASLAGAAVVVAAEMRRRSAYPFLNDPLAEAKMNWWPAPRVALARCR